MKENKFVSAERIWKKNEHIAEELADCYYDSVLEGYKEHIEKDSKENFGFNVFVDGIRIGLDIIIPLLDENHTEKAKQKIETMIKYKTALNKEKILKVKCSFCGKEIECPEHMKDAEKHACFDCFQKLEKEWSEEEYSKVHIDLPMEKLDEIIPTAITEKLIQEDFSNLWKTKKSELKEMSKKELAEQMFAEGIHSMITMMKEKDNFSDEEK